MELNHLNTDSQRTPWNKGRIVGQKAPLKLKEIWAIRFRLQDSERLRELALFNLAIDSKLRGCDLVRLKVNDVAQGGRVLSRAIVVQRKTGQPVPVDSRGVAAFPPPRLGHLPGAVHLDLAELFDADNGTLKPAAELTTLLGATTISPEATVATY